jgi:multiple antibiotic resistance protein
LGHEVSAFLRTVAITLAALLPIINPLGSAPIFLSMTPGASDVARQALARRVARNSLLMLVGATLVGSYVLDFFGLSLAVVKIAGGLLVISTGWHLIRDADTPDAKIVPASPAWSAAEIASKSFFPLTFPLTIGPGSVSVAITLGAGTRAPDLPVLLGVTGSVVGMVVVCVAIYFCYRYAGRVLDMLGQSGTVVFLRLSAFILLAVGVQIFSDGLVERFPMLSE